MNQRFSFRTIPRNWVALWKSPGMGILILTHQNRSRCLLLRCSRKSWTMQKRKHKRFVVYDCEYSCSFFNLVKLDRIPINSFFFINNCYCLAAMRNKNNLFFAACWRQKIQNLFYCFSFFIFLLTLLLEFATMWMRPTGEKINISCRLCFNDFHYKLSFRSGEKRRGKNAYLR